MPQQETFFEQTAGDRRIEVLKTYDSLYAREAFACMDDEAQSFLWDSLAIDGAYEAADLPLRRGLESEEFLWEEMLDAAREDGSQASFFVVNEACGGHSRALYVSPDWPSAETYAMKIVTAAQ